MNEQLIYAGVAEPLRRGPTTCSKFLTTVFSQLVPRVLKVATVVILEYTSNYY